MQLLSVLISLVPLIIGSVAMPTWVLLVVFLLRRGKRRKEAMAFVGGVTLVRLAQGLVYGLVLTAYAVPATSNSRPEVDIVISALLVAGGLLLWAAAVQQWLAGKSAVSVSVSATTAAAGSADQVQGLAEGGPQPRWRALATRITPARALFLGALLVTSSPRAWLFTLGAMGVISQADLRPGISLATYLFYVVGADILIVAPILMSSSPWFDAAASWLELHNRTLVIIVSLVVGSVFLWRGGIGLINGLVPQ